MRLINNDPAVQNKNVKIITSCSTGEIIPLEQIGDEVFSSLILGEGFGVIPSENIFVSPTDGIVKDVSSDERYVTIKTDGGLILIVSIEISKDDRSGSFKCLTSLGEHVSRETPLWEVSDESVSDGSVIAAVVVTNIADIPSFNIRYGEVRLLSQPVMTITI